MRRGEEERRGGEREKRKEKREEEERRKRITQRDKEHKEITMIQVHTIKFTNTIKHIQTHPLSVHKHTTSHNSKSTNIKNPQQYLSIKVQ